MLLWPDSTSSPPRSLLACFLPVLSRLHVLLRATHSTIPFNPSFSSPFFAPVVQHFRSIRFVLAPVVRRLSGFPFRRFVFRFCFYVVQSAYRSHPSPFTLRACNSNQIVENNISLCFRHTTFPRRRLSLCIVSRCLKSIQTLSPDYSQLPSTVLPGITFLLFGGLIIKLQSFGVGCHEIRVKVERLCSVSKMPSVSKYRKLSNSFSWQL